MHIKTSLMCKNCNWPICSANCEGITGPLRHEVECQLLRTQWKYCGSECYRFDLLIAIRALLLSKTNKAKWKQVDKLESHLKFRGPGTKIYKQVQEKAQLIKQILPDVSNDSIHKIYGIFDVNATELTDDFDAEILYNFGSLMEHSCVPNTYQVIDYDNKFKLTVKAALPIKKGEHITSVYTNILWGTQARREHLEKTKYFICNCNRCVDPTELGTYFSAFKCLDNCYGFYLPITKSKYACNVCKKVLTCNEVTILHSKISKDVDKALYSSTNIVKLEELLKTLQSILHPNHYHIFSLKHSLAQMYAKYNIYNDEHMSTKMLSICNNLITMITVLDPGKNRLNIYQAILLHILFLVEFSRMKTKCFSLQAFEKTQYLLEIIKSILEKETNNCIGKKMINAVKSSESDFLKWATDIELNKFSR